jgi:hypothetical protein
MIQGYKALLMWKELSGDQFDIWKLINVLKQTNMEDIADTAAAVLEGLFSVVKLCLVTGYELQRINTHDTRCTRKLSSHVILRTSQRELMNAETFLMSRIPKFLILFQHL